MHAMDRFSGEPLGYEARGHDAFGDLGEYGDRCSVRRGSVVYETLCIIQRCLRSRSGLPPKELNDAVSTLQRRKVPYKFICTRYILWRRERDLVLFLEGSVSIADRISEDTGLKKLPSGIEAR